MLGCCRSSGLGDRLLATFGTAGSGIVFRTLSGDETMGIVQELGDDEKIVVSETRAVMPGVALFV